MPDVRTAFITGASSGIGAALAKLLASEGVEVALAARRIEALEAVAAEIESEGGRARVCPVDVGDPAAVRAVIRDADEAMGGLDLVVANAGLGKTRWSGKLTWADCAPMLQVNVIGATATLIAILDRMVERKHGHLVGISSLAAYRGLPRSAVYSGSKAYLSTFLESLRVDLRGSGIAVTDIRPGYVRTTLTRDNQRMPMAMEADDAVREIAHAIAVRKAVHAFPVAMAMGVRSVAALPNALYDVLAKRML